MNRPNDRRRDVDHPHNQMLSARRARRRIARSTRPSAYRQAMQVKRLSEDGNPPSEAATAAVLAMVERGLRGDNEFTTRGDGGIDILDVDTFGYTVVNADGTLGTTTAAHAA